MAEIGNEKLKMVICAQQPFADELAQRFGELGFCAVGIATSAPEARLMVLEHQPDLLLMEPYLAGMNCDELTACLELEASPELVKVVLSERRQDLLADRFHCKGGDLFRVLPLDYAFTAHQVLQLKEMRRRNFALEGDRQEHLILEGFFEILREIGMPSSINGFRYAADCAMIYMQDPSAGKDFQNLIYPLVAARHQTKGASVEKCLRLAIESACQRGDAELIYRWFHPDPQKGKVENKNFIARLVELYRLRNH